MNISEYMNNLVLRGRKFTNNELNIIQQSIFENYDKGRTYISRDICSKLDWKQPNGWLKDRACRDVLLHLEEIEFITLPPALIHSNSNKQANVKGSKSYLTEFNLSTPITKFPESIELHFAKGNTNEIIWNELVDQYHYLGHNVIVGRCIKYLIMSDSRLLGAISFSSPAWRLKPRDDILKTMGIKNPQEYTINNSRFLILPIVQIKNLASYLLSLATKKIVEDWNSYYSTTPLIAETFVQPSRFEGTCYKAANWLEIGITKGYSKKGQTYRNSQEPKKIFLYGLDKRTRVAMLQLNIQVV